MSLGSERICPGPLEIDLEVIGSRLPQLVLSGLSFPCIREITMPPFEHTNVIVTGFKERAEALVVQGRFSITVSLSAVSHVSF